MGQAKLQTIPLLGLGVDLPETERFENDMTRSGCFCPKDGNELEKVSQENRYTCHYCGGIYELDEEGKVKEGWFEGFA